MANVEEKYTPRYKFEIPDQDERVVLVGRTGSGKSVLGVSILAKSNFDKQPWFLFDFKGERLFQTMIDEGMAQEWPIGAIPKEAGLFIVRPVLPADENAVEELLWEIWRRGHIGIFVDELYMIDRYSPALRSLLVQGRSKHIPMIMLTQRPVEVSKFVWSEASHLVYIDLVQAKDRQHVADFMPIDKNKRTAQYTSRWYNVNTDQLFLIGPADEAQSLALIKVKAQKIAKQSHAGDFSQQASDQSQERPSRILM